uniref:Uncharacterized protein n=1 Tax=Oryza barthii TaxID=65489 RepID=A0A0D3FUP6_9ORYZ
MATAAARLLPPLPPTSSSGRGAPQCDL